MYPIDQSVSDWWALQVSVSFYAGCLLSKQPLAVFVLLWLQGHTHKYWANIGRFQWVKSTETTLSQMSFPSFNQMNMATLMFLSSDQELPYKWSFCDPLCLFVNFTNHPIFLSDGKSDLYAQSKMHVKQWLWGFDLEYTKTLDDALLKNFLV